MLRLLHRIEDAILVLLLVCLLGLAAYQVAARNLFDTGILWGDSLVRVLVLWLALFGAMIASRKNDHISINFLEHLIQESTKKHISRITGLFTAVICLVCAWYSYQFVLFEYEDQVTAFAKVPAWVCEAILPFAFSVIGLRYLIQVVKPV